MRLTELLLRPFNGDLGVLAHAAAANDCSFVMIALDAQRTLIDQRSNSLNNIGRVRPITNEIAKNDHLVETIDADRPQYSLKGFLVAVNVGQKCDAQQLLPGVGAVSAFVRLAQNLGNATFGSGQLQNCEIAAAKSEHLTFVSLQDACKRVCDQPSSFARDRIKMQSKMALEIAEIPHAVARLLRDGAKTADDISRLIRAAKPNYCATVARGSSDHACAFLKYAVELEAGLPVASLGPSIASVYKRPLKMNNCVTIAVSQSGKSPDIVAMAETARRGGSLVVALTNKADSTLAQTADCAFDILAGPELSVAATKSFVNSAVAGLMLLARAGERQGLMKALDRLPAGLEKAVACDWSPLLEALDRKSSLYILGRGPTFPIAGEAALKFKETSGVHAEAYSSAEVMHGPVSIVSDGFPVVAFMLDDESRGPTHEVCRKIVAQGADLFAAGPQDGEFKALPHTSTGHSLTDAITRIASFYSFVEKLSRRRGLDPDKPAHLRKVTETI